MLIIILVAVRLPWTRINDWLAVAGQYWRRKIVGHLNSANNNNNNLDPLKSSCAVVNPIIHRATLSPSSLVVKRDPKHSSPPRPSSHPWWNISLSIRKNCCCGFGDACPSNLKRELLLLLLYPDCANWQLLIIIIWLLLVDPEILRQHKSSLIRKRFGHCDCNLVCVFSFLAIHIVSLIDRSGCIAMSDWYHKRRYYLPQ